MRMHLLVVAAILLTGCASQPPQQAPPAPAGPPPPQFKVTATIRDIMDSMIDPDADFIWDAVSITINFKGTEEKKPRTDEEWNELRRHAVSLMEASNLLIMPGRLVARPGEKPEDPSVELPFDEIETLINKDREAWQTLAHGLHDATQRVLEAIEKKDPEALLNTGDGIFQACESCHTKYWYPSESKDQQPEQTTAPEQKQETQK
jgi:hypothetical protein